MKAKTKAKMEKEKAETENEKTKTKAKMKKRNEKAKREMNHSIRFLSFSVGITNWSKMVERTRKRLASFA